MNPAGQLDVTALMMPFYQRMPCMFVFMIAILLVKVSLRIIADKCASALGGQPRRLDNPGRTMAGLLLLPISLGMLYVGMEGAIPGSMQSFIKGVSASLGRVTPILY